LAEIHVRPVKAQAIQNNFYHFPIMRWLIHDLFDEQPSGSPHHYWLVSGTDQNIPKYITSVLADINSIERIDSSTWDADNYLGGIKVDVSYRKCFIFRLYPGGRMNNRSRWILLGLETELMPLDCNNILQMPCFQKYHLESETAAKFPSELPRIIREEQLSAPLTLAQSANIGEDQLREVSISMTSGLGMNGILLIKRSDQILQGFFREYQPDRQSSMARDIKQTQPVEPPLITTQQTNPPNRSNSGRRIVSKVLQTTTRLIVPLLFFILGWITGHKQANRPPDNDVEIAGPKPGEAFTVRVRGGSDFSFMATNSENTEFKLERRSHPRFPPPTTPMENLPENVNELDE
jgi:hypothetical protein